MINLEPGMAVAIPALCPTHHYRPGCKHSWCHRTQRTVNTLPAPRLQRSTRPLPYGLLATFLWGFACASQRLTPQTGPPCLDQRPLVLVAPSMRPLAAGWDGAISAPMVI